MRVVNNLSLAVMAPRRTTCDGNAALLCHTCEPLAISAIFTSIYGIVNPLECLADHARIKYVDSGGGRFGENRSIFGDNGTGNKVGGLGVRAVRGRRKRGATSALSGAGRIVFCAFLPGHAGLLFSADPFCLEKRCDLAFHCRQLVGAAATALDAFAFPKKARHPHATTVWCFFLRQPVRARIVRTLSDRFGTDQSNGNTTLAGLVSLPLPRSGDGTLQAGFREKVPKLVKL